MSATEKSDIDLMEHGNPGTLPGMIKLFFPLQEFLLQQPFQPAHYLILYFSDSTLKSQESWLKTYCYKI